MEQNPDFAEVLEVASEAGHILLENGAEISRVEDIMNRISTHFGVNSGNFFVLSNGIFTSGKAEKVHKSGGQASTYANVAFIPIRATQLSRVTAVNRLSYDISAGRCSLEEARERLEQIKNMPLKPIWEQLLATTFSAGAFFVSLFQVDNDNPVGAAGAVDGSGAGIFEDIDAFDIVGVNPFYGRNGVTIHNEQRI